MPNLFVDCDYTLILWRDTRGLTSKYDINEELVQAVNGFVDDTGYGLVVWSGGGLDYAARWARMCFPGERYTALAKDNELPLAGDICVDDKLEFKVNAKLYTPEQFIKEVNTRFAVP